MKNLTAIITPTWNNEDFTIRCFDSIQKNTKDYILIWVDNGSKKESIEKVKNFLDEKKVPYELIANDENLGFVKATNQGMKKAIELDVKYLVLQNNDTEVYDGWLDGYIKVAESDSKIGLVGPMTSPELGWQSVDFLIREEHVGFDDIPKYSGTPEEYALIAREKMKNRILKPNDECLAFFSTLIKREVIDEIGFLSEDFGIGFSDDIDYSIRAIKKGWDVVIAMEVFVFHNHSTTFKALYSKDQIEKMLSDNFKIFQKKHSHYFDKINFRNTIRELNSKIKQKTQEIKQKTQELTNIYSSKEFKLAIKLQKIFKKIFPVGSWRRKVVFKLFSVFKKIAKIIFKIKRLIFSFIFKIKLYFSKFKPRKKRNINLNSKKLVFVDHSYHNKTKSNDFLIDFLKEFFDVEVIFSESWLGKPEPDLSFIDESYLGVIFWQSLPSIDFIKNIKNENIIYFPMYDQSGFLELDYWYNYRDLKMTNFSEALHKKFKKCNFESMFVQYFPKPQEFIVGKKDEIFFWQRLTQIHINLVEKILGSQDFKVHLHKAIDPGQIFLQPTEEQEKRYKITYSEWFDTREEMQNLIKEKAIYIAPREYEGIGLSFLEAMAMGKTVIAINNPTMNEYITHGKNGYLFDLKKPKKIDLSNIEEVQKNVYNYMCKGYEKWEKDKYKIIEFIKKS